MTNPSPPEQANDSYQTIAQRYADTVDNNPFHTCYARPAMLSLLPSLQGLSILDVGCGTGWFAEYFIRQGAMVTAFDLNETFVAMTQARVGDAARVVQADLSQPLTFAEDASFDVVAAPLVLHYLKDWEPALQELNRVLKPGGRLVFSTHYPLITQRLFELNNYFEPALITDEWEGVGQVQFYHCSLTHISQSLFNSGFLIEKIVEPQPTPEFEAVNAAKYQQLMTQPWFLLVSVVKPAL